MTKPTKYNIVILGVSYLDGMASSMRVRNLFEPLLRNDDIQLSNLIYQGDAFEIKNKKGCIGQVEYSVIGINLKNPFSLFLFWLKGVDFIRRSKSRKYKNILYNYEYIDIKNIIFLLYARIIGYKIVLDIVEDNRFCNKFPNILNKFKIASSVYFLKLIPFLADSVLAISYHLYDLMNIVCKGKVPVVLIPVTVNFARFKKKEYSIPSRFKIFYGGSFGEKDGLYYLIQAFSNLYKRFKNVELVFTGRASGADFEKIMRYIEESGVKERIVLMGFLETEKYYRTLNGCDIFCVTRVNSEFANAGFPFKLGEFLASGKAVICTNVGDVTKYLTHGRNSLIVKPNSIESLTKSLIYLLENPERIDVLGREGRKVAEQNFDTLALSQKLKDVFNSI